jgi:uncharacterized cupin superfamily protein
MSKANIWTDDWEADDDWSGGGAEAKRLPRGEQLGATLYQLEPGDFVVFHFHHAQEELLIVLRGRPRLRTSEGERELREGDVVHFTVGPDGAHGLKNETNEPVRYVMVSSLKKPEVAEYPDLKKITAFAPTGSQTGEQLWLIHDLERDAPA